MFEKKLSTTAIVLVALLLSSTFAAAAEEQGKNEAVLISFKFEDNVLQLVNIIKGFGQAPDYRLPQEKQNSLEVRTSDGNENVLKKFLVDDPRRVFYDFLGMSGANLSGGTYFNNNAEFGVILPLSGKEKYADVLDKDGNKLKTVDLDALKERVKEKRDVVEASEITPPETKKSELNAVSMLLTLVAAIAAFVLVGGILAFLQEKQELEQLKELTQTPANETWQRK